MIKRVMNGRLDRAYRYCEWITTHHYENFPVASWLLPKRIRPHVAALYAFARAADDFADEAKYQGRSLELLQQWRSALWACQVAPDGATPAHPIFLALSHTIRECRLPVQWLDDLLTAFTMDVTQRRYADWEELMTYCRYSANPVGWLVLALFGLHDLEHQQMSDRICTGLQMANHWQDLRIDLRRDILYVPQTLLRQFHVAEEELLMGAGSGTWHPTDRFRQMMKELMSRTRRLFDEGEPLVQRLRGGLRLEIKLTLLGGRAILDRIESSAYDVFSRRPVLSRADKIRLLIHAALFQ